MKTLIIAMSAIGMTVSLAAQSRPLPVLPYTLSSKLDTLRFDEESGLNQAGYVDGKVELKMLGENQIVVTLNHVQPLCQPGKFCSQIRYPVLTFTADTIVKSVGTCNTTVYTATTDLRRVDGALTKITVVDHQTDTCKYLVAVPPTQVTVEQENLRGVHYVHSFDGNVLQ
jgi:hypothetical protein